MRPRSNMRYNMINMQGDKKEMELESGDAVYRLPELTSDERMRVITELPAHPTVIQVQEKSVEILSRRPAK